MYELETAMTGAKLGDSRRTQRAMRLVAGIVTGLTSDTTAAGCTGAPAPWAQAMGRFRFFNNAQVSLPSLYKVAKKALPWLVPENQRIYVAHDISVVDYSRHNRKKDRIQVGNERGRGYEVYTALVLDSYGRPLGPVATELRSTKGCHSSESEQPLPFTSHYEQVERGIDATTKAFPNRSAVHVMDSEFDEIQLFRYLVERQEHFIIRAKQYQRKVKDGEHSLPLATVVQRISLASHGRVKHARKEYERWTGEVYITLPGRSYRGVKKGEKRKPGRPLRVRVVVTELRSCVDNSRYQWILLTNLSDPREVIVEAYRARWKIERLFYLTKVGFRLESWKQTTGEAVARRLAVSMLAAMVLYPMLNRPEDATIRAVAEIGGWTGRKSDSLGPVVLMRGLFLLLQCLSILERYTLWQLRQMVDQLGLSFAIPAPTRGPPYPFSEDWRCV